jgi:hypothetical protein
MKSLQGKKMDKVISGSGTENTDETNSARKEWQRIQDDKKRQAEKKELLDRRRLELENRKRDQENTLKQLLEDEAVIIGQCALEERNVDEWRALKLRRQVVKEALEEINQMLEYLIWR